MPQLVSASVGIGAVSPLTASLLLQAAPCSGALSAEWITAYLAVGSPSLWTLSVMCIGPQEGCGAMTAAGGSWSLSLA